MPAGFSRFIIKIFNTEDDFDNKIFEELEKTLECELKIIYSQY
jgi:hypothetical protein